MMHTSQVTVPRYRENSLIIPFSMLCAGISQNTKHHHLTLYKGQVWREEPYHELCDNNILNVVYDRTNLLDGDLEKNGKLYVPPVPGIGFIKDDSTQIPLDSEILQSFAQLTHTTNITILSFDPYLNYIDKFNYEIHIGTLKCNFGDKKRQL